jgi:flavin reductase (DIM6/NTAB) family NADH-FMN oxidoreductase RutF
MECKLIQLIPVGRSGKKESAHIVLGEILLFHIDDELYDDGKILTDKYNAVGRLAGSGYIRITDRFEMKRIPYVPKNTTD